MVHKLRLVLLSLYLASVLTAQSLHFAPHALGVNIAAGGIDQPRFQFVDIDGDHDLDLFLLDRDERFWFYRSKNNGLMLESESPFGLDPGSWFRFVDIDHDGDLDCYMSGEHSAVAFHTNTGTAVSPHFQLTASAVKDTSGAELFSERFSVPAFADIDGDGDDDFFTGGSIGSITFYRNIGTPSVPLFAFVTGAFGDILIQGGGRTFPKAMHGASGIEFYDADSNGVLDLFWGDYFNPSLYFLKNSGTKDSPSLALVDSTYPDEAAVTSLGFNLPQHADVDGDGAVDLMIGSLFPTAESDNFHFYRNTGTNAVPSYVLQTKNYLPMIDAGSRSTVAAADFDGDGDRDLVIASALGSVQVHENIGSPESPLFSSSPQSRILMENNFYAVVTAGDLNGDGKPDLLFGNYDGRIRFYVNSSSDGLISFSPAPFVLDGFDAGQNSAPFLADMDGNGTLDLLIGSSGGDVKLYLNSGTAGAPVFSLDPAFPAIDAGNDAIPTVTDVDGDGHLDLIIGNSEGALVHYERTGSAYQIVASALGAISLQIQSAPCFADMDADGDRDLILGNGKGGIYYYRNDGPAHVIKKPRNSPISVEIYQNYPNPFNPLTTITVVLPEDAHLRITIVDLLGRTVETLTNVIMKSGKHSVVWNATNVPAGTYFSHFVVSNGDRRYSTVRRMSLVK